MSKKRKPKNRKKPVQRNRAKQQSNLPAILFFSISGVVIITLLVVFAMNSLGSSSDAETENRYDFTYENQPSLGSEDAPVKIVEFGDYKCPSCKDFQEKIFTHIKQDYIDKGDVQFFYINYPFLAEDSVTAAQVGEAVYEQDEDAFWKYYELVYEHQGSQDTNWATVEFLTSLIADHLPEIDVDEIKRGVENKEFVSAVNQDIVIAGEANVNGTPTLFINGVEFTEWYSYDAVKAEIERLLDGRSDD